MFMAQFTERGKRVYKSIRFKEIIASDKQHYNRNFDDNLPPTLVGCLSYIAFDRLRIA